MIYDKLILNKDNVLRYVTEEQIFRSFITTSFKINKPFSSPLRVDKNPSFNIYIKDNKIRYIDFAKGEVGDCFTFVKQMYSCNFNVALHIIVKRMGIDDKFILTEKNTINIKKSIHKLNDNKQVTTKVIYNKAFIKPTTTDDHDYFKIYSISVKTLEVFKVSRLTHIETKKMINGKEQISYLRFSNREIAYHYKTISIVDKSVKDVGFKVHIPSPTSEGKRFLSYCSSTSLYYNPGLFAKMNNIVEDYLVFTKSMKDSMCLYEMGCLAFSTVSETVSIDNIGGFIKFIIKRVSSLYNKSFKIVLMFDNDDTGRRFTLQFDKYLIEVLKIKPIVVFLETKDISDLIRDKGMKYSIFKLRSIIRDGEKELR